MTFNYIRAADSPSLKFLLSKSKYFFLSIVFLSVFSGELRAQSDSIDLIILKQMQTRKIPGLQLAIVQNGKIIKVGNYGLANVQDSIPVTEKSVFTINSITKAFTGVAIMQLVESEKLTLSSAISSYLPNLPDAWKAVTVLQLLSHTSGIPDIVDEEESVLIANEFDEAWEMIINKPMEFKPGERFRYNQTNYLLLGRIIETLSGMPFTRYIIEGQLQKSNMPKTIAAGFGATKDLVMNAAGGYRYSRGKLVNMFFSFPPPLQTAAGMSSTAAELANWIIALQNLALIAKKSNLDLLWTPAKLNNGKTGGFTSLLNGYAVGWPTVTRDKHPAVAPVGGGRSALFVYPGDNLSIIVLTNLAGASPEVFIDEIARLFIRDLQ